MSLVAVKGKTPYEILYSRKPDYNLLRPFGCLSFTSTLNRDRSKLDYRADPCVFIGYIQNKRGYKLYNLRTKKVFVSRDVVFQDRFFPYQFLTPNEATQQFFLPISSNEKLSEQIPDCSNKKEQTPRTKTKTSLHPNSKANSPRRTRRITKAPTSLQDYVYAKANSHWCNFVQHFASTAKGSQISQDLFYKEPRSFRKATQNKMWVEVMTKALQALKNNQTWDIVDLPKRKKEIGSK